MHGRFFGRRSYRLSRISSKSTLEYNLDSLKPAFRLMLPIHTSYLLSESEQYSRNPLTIIGCRVTCHGPRDGSPLKFNNHHLMEYDLQQVERFWTYVNSETVVLGIQIFGQHTAQTLAFKETLPSKIDPSLANQIIKRR